MRQIRFKELNFPKAMNIELLLEIADEDKLMKFLMSMTKQTRLKRRIVMPSAKCMRKVVAHFWFSKMQDGKISWEKIKKMLQREYGSLNLAGIIKYDMMKLYRQRESEIKKEMEILEESNQ